MNESQLGAIGLSIHISGTHNTGGMAFGHNPFQTKQRKNTPFFSDGLSIVHSKTKQRFFMLPGGRWVEETVYRRFVNKEYKPGDPW